LFELNPVSHKVIASRSAVPCHPKVGSGGSRYIQVGANIIW
jgi:hypothetical protein